MVSDFPVLSVILAETARTGSIEPVRDGGSRGSGVSESALSLSYSVAGAVSSADSSEDASSASDCTALLPQL